ncbi:MAG: zf-HC2 domain-containing protein [Phycisphaerales bacterium]|nr:MAG: zf-HC2 domain-containing protein [Phycisphaerales bacterium]
MNCRELQEWLADYLGDELDENQRQEAERHLASCPACRTEVESLRQTRSELDRLDTIPLDAAVERTGRLKVVRTRPAPVRLVAATLRAAALLILGVFIGWYAAPGAPSAVPVDPTQPETVTRRPVRGTVHEKWIEWGRDVSPGQSSFARNLAMLARSQRG